MGWLSQTFDVFLGSASTQYFLLPYPFATTMGISESSLFTCYSGSREISNSGFYSSLFALECELFCSLLTSSIPTSFPTKYITSSTLSYLRQSNNFSILPSHYCSIKEMAYLLYIYITFIYFLSFVSPIICNLLWFSLIVIKKLTPSMTLSLHNSIILVRLWSRLPICETLVLLLFRSFRTNG